MAGAPSDDQAGSDLADKAMRAIDQLVDTVHDRVIRPILLIGRTIAFAFVIIAAAIVLVVAGVVGVMRLLDVYAFSGTHEWASWALLGAVLVAGGLVLWRRRRPVDVRSGER